jgi:acyl-CoA synthetase (AMP-forming)/AMP-acid ligase II/thioesterase domain-containing protein
MNRLLSLDRVETDSTTIAAAIALQAALNPDRTAVICSGFPALSFRDLDTAVRRIGHDLRAAGIGAASRVAILLPDGPEAAIVGIAACAHAIGYPLDPELPLADVESEIDRAGLDAIVIPQWMTVEAADVSRPVGIFKSSKAASGIDDVRLIVAAEILPEQRQTGLPSAQSVAVIQTSSGSTGLPKHVLITHANVLDVAQKLQRWFGVNERDRGACVLPVHSALGFKVALLAPLLIGSSAVVGTARRADEIAEWCRESGPTWFFAAPAWLAAVLETLRAVERGALKHSLRFVLTGGTYLAEPLRAELQAVLGVPILEQYGAREAGPITANPAPPAMTGPGTVGPASADVAVLDDNGAVLPAGVPGAVAVRGQGISPGYIESLPRGCDVVVGGRSPDDWLLTGDIGVIDADGFLLIVGRAKQIINRGGEKIAPSEVEKALLQHEAVREAAVFAVPHPRLGEGVSAAVTLRTGAQVAPEALQDFLYGRLAPHKIPQRVHIVPALPRTAGGKVSLAALKERFANPERSALPAKGNLEALIVDVWERLLARDDIGVEDNFFDLGGDSLLATTMLLEVEAITRRQIAPADLRAGWTVRQIALALLRDMPPERNLLSRAKPGKGAPFFFCHGDYRDRGIYAFRLVDMIEADAPVVLLNHYRDFKEPGADTLEDMARLYVPRLLEAQPAGPFRIGGYCLGGILAWEIARQLEALGRDVEFLVLIDSPSLNGHAALRAVKRVLIAASSVLPARTRTTVVRNGMWAAWVAMRSRPVGWGAVRKLVRLVAASRFADNGSRPARWDEYRRLSDYVPKRLNTRLYCLVCAENSTRIDFQASNWRHLASSVSISIVPGNHHSCVTTHGNVVAAHLNDIVAEAG